MIKVFGCFEEFTPKQLNFTVMSRGRQAHHQQFQHLIQRNVYLVTRLQCYVAFDEL